MPDGLIRVLPRRIALGTESSLCDLAKGSGETAAAATDDDDVRTPGSRFTPRTHGSSYRTPGRRLMLRTDGSASCGDGELLTDRDIGSGAPPLSTAVRMRARGSSEKDRLVPSMMPSAPLKQPESTIDERAMPIWFRAWEQQGGGVLYHHTWTCRVVILPTI
jgi:hypothetical protein